MISNKERQQKLDVEKWLLSEQLGYDKAGDMDWCVYCEYADDGSCTYLECKKNPYPCSRAYNRMKRDN